MEHSTDSGYQYGDGGRYTNQERQQASCNRATHGFDTEFIPSDRQATARSGRMSGGAMMRKAWPGYINIHIVIPITVVAFRVGTGRLSSMFMTAAAAAEIGIVAGNLPLVPMRTGVLRLSWEGALMDRRVTPQLPPANEGARQEHDVRPDRVATYSMGLPNFAIQDQEAPALTRRRRAATQRLSFAGCAPQARRPDGSAPTSAPTDPSSSCRIFHNREVWARREPYPTYLPRPRMNQPPAAWCAGRGPDAYLPLLGLFIDG